MRGYDTKPASRESRYDAIRKTQRGESDYKTRRYKSAVGSKDAALRQLRALKDKDMISAKEGAEPRRVCFVCVLSKPAQKTNETLKKLTLNTQNESNKTINETKSKKRDA